MNRAPLVGAVANVMIWLQQIDSVAAVVPAPIMLTESMSLDGVKLAQGVMSVLVSVNVPHGR